MNLRARGRRSTALGGGLGVALVLAGCGASETGAFVSIVLPLAVFLGLQRYFVRGLLAGSVKG